MRTGWLATMHISAGAVLGVTLDFAGVAMAGTPVPAPLVGALGPVAMVAVGAGLGAFLVFKKLRRPAVAAFAVLSALHGSRRSEHCGDIRSDKLNTRIC